MRRDFYAFRFWVRNFLTNRRSFFPLNWARYQIWIKAIGEISVVALIFGYITRYAVLPRFGSYAGFVEGSWTFSREKEFQEYTHVYRVQLPSLFLGASRFYAFLFWVRNSLANRRSCLTVNWARYQIWTKATGEISVTALIFDYIFRYAVLPRCGNYPGFVECSWTFSREKEFQEYFNVYWVQLPSLFLGALMCVAIFTPFSFERAIL